MSQKYCQTSQNVKGLKKKDAILMRNTVRLPTLNLIDNKMLLHRTLLSFDYFDHLQNKQIIHFQIPMVVTGIQYMQALIKSNNRKIRICNGSLAPLFPKWSSDMKKEIFYVLAELGEYHYNRFFNICHEATGKLNRKRDNVQKYSMTIDAYDNVIVSMLDLLFETSSMFIYGHLSLMPGNPEFGQCEYVQNNNKFSYIRKPQICLTKTIDSRILNKMKDLNEKLNKAP